MLRLFVALKIPSDVKRNLFEICRKLAGKNDYRWENPQKIHLTLKFIGKIEEDNLISLKESLDFISEYRSFDFRITKFGFFFRDKDPKILWTGLETDERIFKLVHDLNQTLSRFSVPVENRKFKPHLTMLRIKKNPGIEFVNRFKEYSFDEMNFTAKEAVLMKSELLQSGAVYSEIQKYNLM
ncbi:RNA 2',3'-cyclic phosphodiesterase [bacterium BMS3Abin03]|nr:RNA 2',3'-cyclic phosphodiesterase [bacterium BMS3Abin03]MCG6960827.1 RNA 2',3'-cyclic phosphodiesterase [bacterium BMS3Abin03]